MRDIMKPSSVPKTAVGDAAKQTDDFNSGNQAEANVSSTRRQVCLNVYLSNSL